MNFIIINKGQGQDKHQGFHKMFKIMGMNIPQFGDMKDSMSFSSKDDAQKVIDSMASNIANDSKIVKDIFNI